MVRNELLSLVKFDADQLRSAIQKCDREAEELSKKRDEVMALASLYRELLRTHGFENITITPSPGTMRLEGKEATLVVQRRFRDMKLADAIVMALADHGGKLHASRILEILTAGGLRVGRKYPMSTLTTAMRRDNRIEKDPTAKNTWRLKA